MVSCQLPATYAHATSTAHMHAYTVTHKSGHPINSDSAMVSPPSPILMPPPSTIRKRELSTPSSPGDEEGEEEYRPGPSTKRPTGSNGRRPIAPKPTVQGSGSRGSTKMSREAVRKANHSLIERRRREKINFALGELREMVPGLGEEKGGKAGEFKLEVSAGLALVPWCTGVR